MFIHLHQNYVILVELHYETEKKTRFVEYETRVAISCAHVPDMATR